MFSGFVFLISLAEASLPALFGAARSPVATAEAPAALGMHDTWGKHSRGGGGIGRGGR